MVVRHCGKQAFVRVAVGEDHLLREFLETKHLLVVADREVHAVPLKDQDLDDVHSVQVRIGLVDNQGLLRRAEVRGDLMDRA